MPYVILTPKGRSVYRLSRAGRGMLCLAILALVVIACVDRTVELPDTLPTAEELAGWERVGEIEVYDGDSLYALVNGEADSFFAFGFEEVAVGRYAGPGEAMVEVEVWRLATSADAYGLFRSNAHSSQADLGNGADLIPGRRLVFWQNRYYVQVQALPQAPDDTLLELGQAVAEALPSGAERPQLVVQLPTSGLVEDSISYFHQEISIQDKLWLGGVNLLGLSPETEGVLANYRVDATEVRLLVVDYPQSEAASRALAALAESDLADLAAYEVRDTRLAAVVGQLDQATTRALLDIVLLPE
jgi:hypothetical protein